MEPDEHGRPVTWLLVEGDDFAGDAEAFRNRCYAMATRRGRHATVGKTRALRASEAQAGDVLNLSGQDRTVADVEVDGEGRIALVFDDATELVVDGDTLLPCTGDRGASALQVMFYRDEEQAP